MHGNVSLARQRNNPNLNWRDNCKISDEPRNRTFLECCIIMNELIDLEESINWFPTSIASELKKGASLTELANSEELLGFRNYIILIRDGDLCEALAQIISEYDDSHFKTALMLCRARIHFLLSEYTEMNECLLYAEGLGEDPPLTLSTASELRELLKKRLNLDLNHRDDWIDPSSSIPQVCESSK
jgi:hypothetical protein